MFFVRRLRWMLRVVTFKKIAAKLRESFGKNCIIGKDAVLYKTARIINSYGDANAIVVGAGSHVKGELLTFGHGGRIRIGQYCFIGEDTRIWSASAVTVGDRVLIGHNVNIFDNLVHPINPRLRHLQFKEIVTQGQPRTISLKEEPVVIKQDAWIGSMSVILPGITIGEGAIVGAGSVVTKDVPPFVIVAGNPAKVMRELTLEERQ